MSSSPDSDHVPAARVCWLDLTIYILGDFFVVIGLQRQESDSAAEVDQVSHHNYFHSAGDFSKKYL